MIEVIFLAGAEADVQTAYERRESFREGGGDRFLRELDRCADLLGRYPRVGRPHRGVHRKLLVPNHPYGVFYAVLKSDSIKRVYALKVNDDESDSILSCIVDLWIENRNDSQECGIAEVKFSAET